MNSSGACGFSFRHLEDVLVPSENTGSQVCLGRAKRQSQPAPTTVGLTRAGQGRAEPENQVSCSLSSRADVILLGTGSRPMSTEAKEATQSLLPAHGTEKFLTARLRRKPLYKIDSKCTTDPCVEPKTVS